MRGARSLILAAEKARSDLGAVGREVIAVAGRVLEVDRALARLAEERARSAVSGSWTWNGPSVGTPWP